MKTTITKKETFRQFDDLKEIYNIKCAFGEFNLIKTTFGAYDENDNLQIGLGEETEVFATSSNLNAIIVAIYESMKNSFEESDIYDETIYNSFAESLKACYFTDYSTPDNNTIENILQIIDENCRVA